MSKKSKRTRDAAADAAAEAAAPGEPSAPGDDAAAGTGAGPEAAAVQPAPGEEAAARLEAEVAELRDRLLRAMAELENYRRRAERERQDIAKYAIAAFARDCLSVVDNLRRGLDSVSAADRKANPALETLAAGMELTERELLATLERHGIARIDPLGEPFDHNFHQAMLELEDKSAAPGTVVQVMQPGYTINGRLLRPALVGVAKGGPAPASGDVPKDAGPKDAGPKDAGGDVGVGS
jgi:molecular chaperone GrpE